MIDIRELDIGTRFLAYKCTFAVNYAQIYEFKILEKSKHYVKVELNDTTHWMAYEDFDRKQIHNYDGYHIVEIL